MIAATNGDAGDLAPLVDPVDVLANRVLPPGVDLACRQNFFGLAPSNGWRFEAGIGIPSSATIIAQIILLAPSHGPQKFRNDAPQIFRNHHVVYDISSRHRRRFRGM